MTIQKPKPRLVGLDLFRGLAVLAVVILHADEGVTNPPVLWQQIINFSDFAVPFFLATSFYLACQKILRSSQPYRLKPRLNRLLIPYFIWTGIYILYKILKYFLVQEMERSQELFADIIGLFLLGGAAFHLYFLPLLLTGTVLVKITETLAHKKINLSLVIVLCVASIGLYEFINGSNNSFQLGANVAFRGLTSLYFSPEEIHPIFRLFLVMIAWSIRCLPYILVSFILSMTAKQWQPNITSPKSIIILFIAFLGINSFSSFILPPGLEELFRGFSALLFALSLSTTLQDRPWISHLSVCSFGIYLMHLLFVEALQILGNRISIPLLNQDSTLSLLTITLISFFISWGMTALLIQKKSVSKFIFGT